MCFRRSILIILYLGILGPIALCTGSRGLDQNDAPPDSRAPEGAATELKVMTWNISLREFLREDRVKEVRRIVLTSQADVVAFQEMTPEYYELLISDPAFSNTYRMVPGNPARIKGRLVFATRLPVVESRYIRLPGRMGRYAQKTVFEVPVKKAKADARAADYPESQKSGQPGKSQKPMQSDHPADQNLQDRKQSTVRFTALNVHLESYLEDGPIRASQIRRVIPLIRAPALLLGDLNFGDGPEAAIERESLPSGYRDLWKERHGSNPGLTWNQEENPLSLMFRFDGEKSRRLDYILLFEKSWKLQEIEMLGQEKVLQYRGKPVPPSDHYAIFAHLIVAEEN